MSGNTEGGLVISLALTLEQEALLTRKGTVSRALFALTTKPEGMTVEEIGDLLGIQGNSVYVNAIRPLFNHQLVEKIYRRGREPLYRIPRNETGYGLSLAYPEARRGEE